MRYSDPFEIMAALIPLMAFFGFIIVMIIRTVQGARLRELELKARILALEKDQPLPVESEQYRQDRGSSMLVAGIIFVCSGIGVAIALAIAENSDDAIWGVIPVSVGIGMIIASKLNQTSTSSTEGK